MAQELLVNSRFTGGVFSDTFKRLAARGVAPKVRVRAPLAGVQEPP
jgi:hypothetical protein